MTASPIALPDLDLNQNLWALAVAYAALGAAESWGLKRLTFVACITAILLSLSVVITTGFYTYEYCVRKLVKTRQEIQTKSVQNSTP
jgi:hypothetical protein